MNNKTRMFGVAVLILTLIVAVILGVAISPCNPLAWLLIAALVLLPYIYRKMTSRQYVQWKDECSVGIESIDSQRKKLLGLINSLQTAVNYKTGEAFEREALVELVDYTKTHFKEDISTHQHYYVRGAIEVAGEFGPGHSIVPSPGDDGARYRSILFKRKWPPDRACRAVFYIVRQEYAFLW